MATGAGAVNGLLVAGATSDAGKSVITTGLCRLLARRGVKVAPFKAQNMSNNSMVVLDQAGRPGEIGRAQWIQALAAQVEPEVAMNPVLLKPGGDSTSHLVLLGRPAGRVGSRDFLGGREELARIAFAAFDDLAARHDVVIAEGAGSPTEINLRPGDFVNLGLARHADLPVLVVGDIDRGGLYAALFGTVALLEEADQRLMAAFLINQFRGDQSLLEPANQAIARVTGRPVLGVVPWRPEIWLDSEDGLDLAGRRSQRDDPVRVAVIRLPRVSNFTDVDALGLEPDVDVSFVSQARDLSDAELVVLPGTRATLDDLAWLRARGLERPILAHAQAGRPLLGICGGCQMLGRRIADPAGTEGTPGRVAAGLGLLDLSTEFGPDKVLRLHRPGYEIHHGRVSLGPEAQPWPGGARSGAVLGTMRHGELESDQARTELLALARPGRPASGVSFAAAREARLELLADLIERHCEVDRLLDLIEHGPPPGLPVLPPAGTAST
ncbi:MAG: cobyric acid synthase [Propionibacteriaceae bacterium]|jgi:adenosylcobyric acid synthase|nr:cobyric acid synthase [Propionibacteriaceae bacterium]